MHTNRSALFNPGNEPSFQTPFLYNYMNGKQYKTVETTRNLINTCSSQFTSHPFFIVNPR